MKKYFIVFVNSVLVQLNYKFNFITNIFNKFLTVIVAVFTWNAIYASVEGNIIANFTRLEMIVYIIIANLSMTLFSTSKVVTLSSQVRNGKLTTHLLRPYSFLWYYFSDFLGERFIYIILYILALLTNLVIGTNIVYTIYAFIFLICNILMFYIFISFVGNLGFWLFQMWPLRGVMNSLYILFGGLLFPLNLLPEKIYSIVSKNPFSMVAYQYTLVLQNSLSLVELQKNILISILWAIIFYILYNITFKKGLLQYEGMGA